MKSYLRTWLVLVSLLLATSAQAGSATWSASPASGDWNTAANWMPNTVPNSPTDIATFATATVTQVSLTSTIDLASLQFNRGADSFSFTASGGAALVFVGDGAVIFSTYRTAGVGSPQVTAHGNDLTLTVVSN